MSTLLYLASVVHGLGIRTTNITFNRLLPSVSNKAHLALKMQKKRGAWVAQSVKRLTLDVSSSLDVS